MVNALQVGRAMKLRVAMANGTTGRPDIAASVAMPTPALRAGPGGTSAVMATVAPEASARKDSRMAVAPPRFRRLLPAPAPLIRCMPKRFKHGADDLGVAVARHHGAHIGRTLGLELRQEQELPVPHGEDLGMLVEQLGVGIGRIALDRARRVDEADIGREQRAAYGRGGLRC